MSSYPSWSQLQAKQREHELTGRNSQIKAKVLFSAAGRNPPMQVDITFPDELRSVLTTTTTISDKVWIHWRQMPRSVCVSSHFYVGGGGGGRELWVLDNDYSIPDLWFKRNWPLRGNWDTLEKRNLPLIQSRSYPVSFSCQMYKYLLGDTHSSNIKFMWFRLYLRSSPSFGACEPKKKAGLLL